MGYSYRSAEASRRLNTLVAYLRMTTDEKADMVYSYTGGRTRTSREMLATECSRMTDHLQKIYNERKAKSKTAIPDDPANRMRRKVLSICHEMNWRKDGKIDWPHLNEWMLKYSYLHKELNAYTEQELPKLITQFENLLRTYYAKG